MTTLGIRASRTLVKLNRCPIGRSFGRLVLAVFADCLAGGTIYFGVFLEPCRSDAIRTAFGHHSADPGDRPLRQCAAGGERASGDAGTPPNARGVARVSDRLCGTAGFFVRRSCLSGLDAPVG